MRQPIFEWHQMQRPLSNHSAKAMYSARADCGQCNKNGFCCFIAMTGTRDDQPGVMPVCGPCLVALAPNLPSTSFGVAPTKIILSRQERRTSR